MKERFRQIYLEITNICNLQCPFCHKDNSKKFVMYLLYYLPLCSAPAKPHIRQQPM